MNALQSNFELPERVARYLEQGPPVFSPGHAGLLQMIGVLIAERAPRDGRVLIVGAGGGLETRYLASVAQHWTFVGVDPSPPMLELARLTAGPVAGERLDLVRGTVADAPMGPFDAATCLFVLGLVPDGGEKQALLKGVRSRLKPGAPFILVDQCIDRSADDLQLRLDRYAAYALASGVEADLVAIARGAMESNASMVPSFRNEQLLIEAGFNSAEVFYVGMAWRGWVAYA